MIFVYWTITIYGIPFQGISTNQTSSKYSPLEVFPFHPAIGKTSQKYPQRYFLTTPIPTSRCARCVEFSIYECSIFKQIPIFQFSNND